MDFSNFCELRNYLECLLKMQFSGTYHLRLRFSRFEAQEFLFLISFPDDSSAGSLKTTLQEHPDVQELQYPIPKLGCKWQSQDLH